jgi:hypothetical protein
MIICLACGNCTDSKYCEVCGMKLTNDESYDDLHNPPSPGEISAKSSSDENNANSSAERKKKR